MKRDVHCAPEAPNGSSLPYLHGLEGSENAVKLGQSLGKGLS